MRLRVRIPGHLKEYVPRHVYERAGGEPGDFTVDVDGPLSLRELLLTIGLRPELAIGALLSGQRISRDDIIGDDGEIIILSPIAGGQRDG